MSKKLTTRQLKMEELMARLFILNRQLSELESLAGVSPKLEGSYWGGNTVRFTWNRDKDGLTIRERRFVQEYPKDLNATKAAIRAGYSIKGAPQRGTTLLKRKKVVTALKKEYRTITRRNNIEVNNVVKEIAKIGFSNMKDFVTWSNAGIRLVSSDDLTREDTACIKEVSETRNARSTTVKVKLYDKPSALVTLCRYLGILDTGTRESDQDLNRKASKLRKFMETVNNSVPASGDG